ncbi:transporter [Peribacillus tepidiphilus]|uniref:transporter n=1 Tax=Peribacillus tepidiphilus TaxID=2652445 RepID=UPI001CDD7C2A|nr:transporter [Peribacillus tepidiphilus]
MEDERQQFPQFHPIFGEGTGTPPIGGFPGMPSGPPQVGGVPGMPSGQPSFGGGPSMQPGLPSFGGQQGSQTGPPFGGQQGGQTGPPFGGQQGGQTGPPSGPPPAFTPQQTTLLGGPQGLAVDPGSLRNCLYRFTFIWLNNGRSFWFYPTFIGRNSVAGYRWRRRYNRWVYFGLDTRNISSFQCF